MLAGPRHTYVYQEHIRTQIRAEREPWGKKIELLISCVDTASERRSVAKEVIFRKCVDGEVHNGPTIAISGQDAQVLMDDLWRCGLRPTEGIGSVGQLAATERHLADMQALAKGLLRKDGVEV